MYKHNQANVVEAKSFSSSTELSANPVTETVPVVTFVGELTEFEKSEEEEEEEEAVNEIKE